MTELTPEQRARALAKAQRILQSQSQSQQPVDFRLGGLYENIMGGVGAVDTPGELIGETIKTTAAGATRGIEGLLGLPETVGALAKRGFQFARGQEVQPMPDQTVLGGAFRRGVSALTGLAGDPNAMDFVPDSRLGRFAGTAGEFLGGAGALTKLTKPVVGTSVVAGVGSEAAGQATEDTAIGGVDIEPFARIAGAIATPTVANKTISALSRQSFKRPSLITMKNESDANYAAVKRTQVAEDIVKKAAADAKRVGSIDYRPNLTQDSKVGDALQKMDELVDEVAETGKTRLIIFDKYKRELNKYYNESGNPALLAMAEKLDDALASNAGTDAKIKAARASYARFRKAQLLDFEFNKDVLQTAGTGIGGNLVNKYKQTLTSILFDPKKSRFFDDTEKQAMETIVNGKFGDNTLRLIGKLSPNSSGLMAALNIGAAVNNPALLGVTVSGALAKGASERRTQNAIERLQDYVAAGGSNASKKEVRDVYFEIVGKPTSIPGAVARTAGLPSLLLDEEEPN